ncbi:MAG: hypothetical protein KJ957_08070 [Candidatus Omnitrophica bacterium]|nr:hypothetical protein [Candidatus Omnitrophota bacterium]
MLKTKNNVQGAALELLALNLTGSLVREDDIFNSYIEENRAVILDYKDAYESNDHFDTNKIYNYLEGHILRKVKNKLPVVFLSGGVDSALIALVLKKNNIDFMNFSYILSENDAAYERIRYVEHKLGIKSEIFVFDRDRVARISKDYFSYYDSPILDGSALVTCDLCCETLKNISAKKDLIFIDGTGADALYGFSGNTVREALKERLIYLFSNKFTDQLKFKGYILNVLTSLIARQHRHLPCKNYVFPKIIKKEAKDFIRRNPEVLFNPVYDPGHSYYTKNMLSDLYDFSIKQMCYKTYAPIVKSGHDIMYPFLSSELMHYAFGLSNKIKTQPSLKQPLKSILIQEGFDERFVYAHKRGFGFDLYGIFDFSFIKSNYGLLRETGIFNDDFDVFLTHAMECGDKRYSWSIYGIFMSILYLTKYYKVSGGKSAA